MGNRKRVMVNYTELFAEKNKINSVLDDKLVKVSTLQESATDYITDDVLTGYAYSASKQYFNDIHIPMFGIFKDCVESLREANSKIETDYIAKVGFYHLMPMDTETLYNYIDKYNKNIASLRADRDSIQFKSYTNTFDGSDVMKQAAIDSINSQISANEAEIRELNDIITRLYDFNDTAFGFATAGTGLESAAFRINQFVELVDSLASFDLDKDNGREANLFCDYHWKERGDNYEIKDKIERAYKDIIRRRLRTSVGDINWNEVNRIYTSGDEIEKDILLLDLMKKYNIPNGMSLDSALSFVAVINPDIINTYFSNIVDDYGCYDFDVIEDMLGERLSETDAAMLYAAFYCMDNENKAIFLERAYGYDRNEVHQYRNTDKLSLGVGVDNLWSFSSKAITIQWISDSDSDASEQIYIYSLFDAVCYHGDADLCDDLSLHGKIPNLNINNIYVGNMINIEDVSVGKRAIECSVLTICGKKDGDANIADHLPQIGKQSSYLFVPTMIPNSMDFIYGQYLGDDSKKTESVINSSGKVFNDLLGFTPVGDASNLVSTIDDESELIDIIMEPKTVAQIAAERDLGLMDLSAYGYLATGYIDVSNGTAHITNSFQDENRFLGDLESYYECEYTKEEIKEKVYSGELMGTQDEIDKYITWYIKNR